MELKWLEDLLALERERSFSKAAAVRHVTQPQFSRRIQALERWAGGPLVQRDAGMLLTPAGQALVEAARTSTAALQQAKERLQQLSHGTGGAHAPWLTVATGRTLSRTALPQWLHQCCKRMGHGGVRSEQPFRLKLLTGSLQEMTQHLVNGRADLMLCVVHPRLPLSLDERAFESVTVGHDELVAVSAPQGKTGKPLHTLPGIAKRPTPVMVYTPSLSMWHVLQDAWLHDSRERHIQVVGEADFAEAMAGWVLAGHCAAWLPLGVVRDDLAQGRLVRSDATAPRIGFELRLVRRRGEHSAVAQAVWDAS
jgi:LysR family transcriptional regulator, hypochlorite-specific transcription factor HypT